MKLADAYSDLVAFDQPVFETKEAAARLQTTAPTAVKILNNAQAAGLARRIRRGLWTVKPDLDPFVVAPYLTAPFPAYVSMWSALARHDMIEQIPARVYVVSLDHAKTVKTTVGEFDVHHITPELFGGFDTQRGRFLATAEKALFDTIYFQAQSGGRSHFPELDIPKRFNTRQLKTWADAIPSKRLQTITRRELDRILTG